MPEYELTTKLTLPETTAEISTAALEDFVKTNVSMNGGEIIAFDLKETKKDE